MNTLSARCKYTISTLSVRNQNAVSTLSAYNQHTINTLSAHCKYPISTQSAHIQYAISFTLTIPCHYATFTLPVHYYETISKPRPQSANYQHTDSKLPAHWQHATSTLSAHHNFSVTLDANGRRETGTKFWSEKPLGKRWLCGCWLNNSTG